jgi:alcohol dehydrogenase
LPEVNSQPDDGAARVNLCVASFMYNRAWDTGASGSTLGVVSALAHSLDTRFPECSHGAAYSINTAPGMRFNRDYNLKGQARVAAAMGLVKSGTTDLEAADAAADAVSRFFETVGMPLRLRDVGVPEAGIEDIAQDALTDFGLHRNVRPINDAAELRDLLRAAW